MIVALSPKQFKQLRDNYLTVADWVANHAELCEEEDELARVDKAHGKVREILDFMVDNTEPSE